MKSDNKDHFQHLGIKTPETVTNSEVEEAYFEKMLELYILVREAKERIDEDEKIQKEDEYKEELYNRMKGAPSTKAGIVLLEKLIDELGDTKKEKVNFQLQIAMYREAYDILRNEDSRKAYWRKTVKRKACEYHMEDIIKKYGGNPKEQLETSYINVGNNPLNVQRKKGIVPYDVQYEDDEMMLILKDEILFESNIVIDSLKEYLLVMKTEDNMNFDCTVQGKIIFPYLSNSTYRALLFQAILQSRREGNSYFGEIVRVGDKYIIKKDKAQELAIEKMQEIDKQKRREKIELKQEDDGR